MSEEANISRPALGAYGFLLSALVFAADQLSKAAILRHFDAFNRCGPDMFYAAGLCETRLGTMLSFTMVWNHGVSMSLITGGDDRSRWIITAITLGITAIVGWWLARERDQLQAIGYAMIFGGAVGNILDRLRFGAVVDFIHVHMHLFGADRSFWVFNLADAAITVGVALLLLRSVAGQGKQAPDVHN